MIYLEIIEKESKDLVFFDNPTEKDNWLKLKKIEQELKNEEEIKIMSEGDLSHWVKQRKPNISALKKEVKQLKLNKRKLKLEEELKLIEQQLINLDSADLIDLRDSDIEKDPLDYVDEENEESDIED